MKSYSILNIVCVLIAVASLSLAYILTGYWLIILAFLGMILFWIRLKRSSLFRTSSALLSIFICLAAIGVTVDLSMPLILIACTAALASWDLTNFGGDLIDNRRLESYHLRSLGVAACMGLVLALIGSNITLHIPFGVTFLLALIAIGCLTYGLRSLPRA